MTQGRYDIVPIYKPKNLDRHHLCGARFGSPQLFQLPWGYSCTSTHFYYNGSPFVYMYYTYYASLYLYTCTCTCTCTCIMYEGKLTRALWSTHALHLQLGHMLLTTFIYTDKASRANEHKIPHAFMHSGVCGHNGQLKYAICDACRPCHLILSVL